jgi:hypothetical protein
MCSNSKKYFIENVGPFVMLSEGDVNELLTYDMELVQAPAILFMKQGYRYSGDEILLSNKELATLVKMSLNNSIN